MIEDILVIVFSIMLILFYSTICIVLAIVFLTISWFCFTVNPIFGILVLCILGRIFYLIMTVLLKEYKDDI